MKTSDIAAPQEPVRVQEADYGEGNAGGVQLLFAKLQLFQSHVCRLSAHESARQVEDCRKKLAECAQFVAMAQSLKGDGTGMPKEMEAYMLKHKLRISSGGGRDLYTPDYANNIWKKLGISREQLEQWTAELAAGRRVQFRGGSFSSLKQLVCRVAPPYILMSILASRTMLKSSGHIREFNANEWDLNIKSLSAKQEELASLHQTQITYLQDFMGQCSSYLDGAREAIRKGNALEAKIKMGQGGQL